MNRILAHRGASSRGDPEGGARLGVLGLRGEKPWREEARGADPRRLRPGAEQPLGFCPVAVAGDKALSRSSSEGQREVRHPQPKPPGGAPRGERTGLESVRSTPRKRGQTRLASAIVECAVSALRPPLGWG